MCSPRALSALAFTMPLAMVSYSANTLASTQRVRSTYADQWMSTNVPPQSPQYFAHMDPTALPWFGIWIGLLATIVGAVIGAVWTNRAARKLALESGSSTSPT